MLFQNGKLLVRKLKTEDKYKLVKWLSDPNILKYYEGRDNPFDLEKVNREFYQRGDHVNRCIIEYDRKEIGYIQYYLLDDDTRKSYGYDAILEKIYGLDQFIGEIEYWNKGVGKLLIKSMVNFLIEVNHADRVVMDPQTWNERAIHCYTKSGFKKVKLLPNHELHEGKYRDCWLIEYINLQNKSNV